jgi:hypothetical protein
MTSVQGAQTAVDVAKRLMQVDDMSRTASASLEQLTKAIGNAATSTPVGASMHRTVATAAVLDDPGVRDAWNGALSAMSLLDGRLAHSRVAFADPMVRSLIGGAHDVVHAQVLAMKDFADGGTALDLTQLDAAPAYAFSNKLDTPLVPEDVRAGIRSLRSQQAHALEGEGRDVSRDQRRPNTFERSP